MLKIYHASGTRGFRVIWLCEELQLPYVVQPVDMTPAYRASSEWRRMNPVGKVPVMTDGELQMYESGAMVQYLLDRYGNGQLQPAPGTAEHALYLQWSWFGEATFGRALGEIVNHGRAFGDAKIAAVIDEMAGRARLCMQALEQRLRDHTYLLGDEFSAADITFGYSLRGYQRLVGTPWPEVVDRYWTALSGRPAYRAAEVADKNAIV